MDTGSNLSKTCRPLSPGSSGLSSHWACPDGCPAVLVAMGGLEGWRADRTQHAARRSRSTASGLLQMVLVQYEAVRAAYMASVQLHAGVQAGWRGLFGYHEPPSRALSPASELCGLAAGWLVGLPGPMLQHSRLEPGSGKISELHPRQKKTPLLQLHNGCHVCIGSVTLIEPAPSSKLSETIKSPGAGPAGPQALHTTSPAHLATKSHKMPP